MPKPQAPESLMHVPGHGGRGRVYPDDERLGRRVSRRPLVILGSVLDRLPTGSLEPKPCSSFQGSIRIAHIHNC
jgi:hypothetical protein